MRRFSFDRVVVHCKATLTALPNKPDLSSRPNELHTESTIPQCVLLDLFLSSQEHYVLTYHSDNQTWSCMDEMGCR